MEQRNNKSAFKATHPGEVLQMELEERGLTQKAFAEKLGMSPSHLNELLRGKRSMTMAVADRLQELLGIDSQSWMNLQMQYNYDMRAQNEAAPSNVMELRVSVEDKSLLKDIAHAITLLRGVRKVAVL